MLRKPIAYLEKRDFVTTITDGVMDANLVTSLRSSPVFVMFQSSMCHHCTMAKPAFQQLADLGIVQCMTVQADGERQSERDIVPILNAIYPNFKGYPSFMLFVRGQKIPYTGSRDVTSMKNFVSGYI
jgi:thiol-disulfide isomerase/thioredoxin